ncbi:unnamed protein product [Agarophyton chilense]
MKQSRRKIEVLVEDFDSNLSTPASNMSKRSVFEETSKGMNPGAVKIRSVEIKRRNRVKLDDRSVAVVVEEGSKTGIRPMESRDGDEVKVIMDFNVKGRKPQEKGRVELVEKVDDFKARLKTAS